MSARPAFLPFALVAVAIFSGGLYGSAQVRAAETPLDASDLIGMLKSDSFLEASAVASDVLARGPQDVETIALCGLALLKVGRVEEAEALFRGVISLSPDNPEAHLGLGWIARMRNDPNAAITHLRRAVRSEIFCEEAFRQLWKAGLDRGSFFELMEIDALAGKRFGKIKRPVPGWFVGGFRRVSGFCGKRFFEMTGRFEQMAVPLLRNGNHSTRMILLRLNGKSDHPFDIDSGSPDFMTVSPELAENLGLRPWGESSAVGLGGGNASVRFAVLDSVEIGSITFRNVPVMVSDLFMFGGMKKGLIGTGFLKRFNGTIDVRAGTLELFPLDRPDLLRANISPDAVAAEVPLYLCDAAAVEARVEGMSGGLYILDTAAGANLVDSRLYMEFLKPAIDPARIARFGIIGTHGIQSVNRVDDLWIKLGPYAFSGQSVSEFSMDAMNSATDIYAAGLLGNPVLWPYRVHFDFRKGRLILESCQ